MPNYSNRQASPPTRMREVTMKIWMRRHPHGVDAGAVVAVEDGAAGEGEVAEGEADLDELPVGLPDDEPEEVGAAECELLPPAGVEAAGADVEPPTGAEEAASI